ncbi:phenylacetate--CoA ligase [Alkalihalobacillus berkeleyi]|uniref:Phenylacetate-coenzyme A ligase n=2 Tax=Pseudalkalibacillus berkeleyi TaxID=1069813 RepID=A0ABS9GU67_9BACL|nr:phenylacetate--CoA ligase PaaK [Pseudalkalibacillus berkeleyi]MCF6136224.1 phenylacetate--CoA ligase [Pseudalkalibacillus berkeleyi]
MIYNVEMETMEISQKEQLQLERLKKTAETVYERVPFYKKKFEDSNITPDKIRKIEDLRKLPFTVKQDLRDHYPFGLFAVDQKEVVRLHASSGTSGKPTVVGYTKNDINLFSEVVARSIAAAGGIPGNVLHNAYGYGLFTGGLGLHYGSEQLGMATVPVSGGNTSRQILLIEDFKPQVICGTPSYILNIAETMEKMGKDPRKTSLKYGIFGAEPWSEEMRQTLEEKLDIKAVDIYGLSEIIGPGVSIECHEAQDGLHIADDHFYVEVIDPDTLQPVADGEYGELVFTSLTKEAFPIIRYRTGDIAAINRETCTCGRTSVRMTRVKGRIDDMLIIRGVNVFPSEIENCLLQLEEIVPHYQIQLKKNGTMDQVVLQVEVSDATYNHCLKDMNHVSLDELKAKIQQTIKSNCLVSIEIDIKEPNSVPRSEGKAVRVVDLRKEEVLQK